MENITSYGSDALAEVYNPDNVDNNMINQGVQVKPSSEQSSVVNHSNTEITNELHVTWDHLEKKWTRLRTNTKTLEDLCSQSLEKASPAIHDAVTTHQVTASHLS
ncbi:hypothetical protein Tco_0712166 [Tanacetum coccineum]